jgi:hypothetical protein
MYKKNFNVSSEKPSLETLKIVRIYFQVVASLPTKANSTVVSILNEVKTFQLFFQTVPGA